MLRVIRPDDAVGQMLKWEGIILDPLGAILAVFVLDLIVSGLGHGALPHPILYFAKMLTTGILLGFISGIILSEVLIRQWLPEHLISIVVLYSVISVFVLVNLCYSETGLLAVTIMGLVLANRKHLDLTAIIEFKETLSTLLIASLFIVLAARIDLNSLQPMILPSILLFSIMQLFIRPFKVLLTTIGSNYTLSQKIVLSWIAPRGIIAAAIASLFEIELSNIAYPNAGFITPLIFLIIVWSVILPSLTGLPLARWLKVSDLQTDGILIIGANQVARKIAAILSEYDCYVLLADSDWEDISVARMEGLQTYYGNPVSEHAEYNLNLLKIGRLLSITPNTELGVLAGLHFGRELGKKEIYYLQSEKDKTAHEKYTVATQHRGKKLFNEKVSYEKIVAMLDNGAEIRSTLISDKFSYEDYISLNDNILPLFAFDTKNKLIIFTPDSNIKPLSGWAILSLGFFS